MAQDTVSWTPSWKIRRLTLPVFAFAIDATTALLAICFAFALKSILKKLNTKLDNGEHLPGVTKLDAKGETIRTHFRFLY
jgi:hypothetical protein